MTTAVVQVINPTDAKVTVNSQDALAKAATTLTVDESYLSDWVAAGCSLIPGTLTGQARRRTKKIIGYSASVVQR
jgi:hypothetical protein